MSEAATAEVVAEESPMGPVDIPAPADWREGIPEDIRDGLGDVDNLADLAKGYVNAQSLVGSGIRIPGKEAGEGDWQKFYDRFKDVPGLTRYNPEDLTSLYDAAGRPQDSKSYGVEGASESFLEVAHAAGLNRQQVESLMEYDQNQSDSAESAQQAELNSGINALRGEWGLAFDHKVAEGQRAVAFLEEQAPGLAEALNATGAGDSPPLIKMFQALGANLKEPDGLGGSTASESGMTPMEAKAQIAEIQNNEQHPFHQGEEAALDHYLELHRYALGER